MVLDHQVVTGLNTSFEYTDPVYSQKLFFLVLFNSFKLTCPNTGESAQSRLSPTHPTKEALMSYIPSKSTLYSMSILLCCVPYLNIGYMALDVLSTVLP